MSIAASPFHPEVFDPYQVRVGRLPIGFVGKAVVFEGDFLFCSISFNFASLWSVRIRCLLFELSFYGVITFS
jgi:hypothetical protein